MMGKRQFITVLILFGLFVAEGSILPLLIPTDWQTRLVPHLTYVMILFIAVYDSRHKALALGLIFGLLHDVVYYGAMIGPYSFAMGFSAYLIGLVFKPARTPLPFMLFAVLSGSLVLDSVLYGTYRLFELDHESYNWALINHILPGMIFHFIFALVIYVPLRRYLEKGQSRPRSQEEKA